RLLIQTGENVGVGGFIVTGTVPKQVVVRGIGPSLVSFGVPNALADPILELHGPPGFITIINDDWPIPFGEGLCSLGAWAPPNTLESCIAASLESGAYTAIVKGKNHAMGVGLIEVYDLGQTSASKLMNLSARGFVNTGGDIMIAGFIMGGNAGQDTVV